MHSALLSFMVSAVVLADPKALAKQLFNQDQAVVLKTIDALGQTGKVEAVAPLCTVLKDGAPVLRTAAATALGHLRLNKALVCLTAAKGDADAEVQQAVQAATLLGSTEVASRLLVIDSKVAPVGAMTDAQVQAVELKVRKRFGEMRVAQSYADEAPSAVTALMKLRKIKAYQLRILLTWADDKFTTEIMALQYPEMSLRGSWRVSGSGGELQELVDAVVPSVVDDAAADLELK